MAQRRIRVVIADDSLVVRELIAQILGSDPEIEVVGQARDGREAVEMVNRLRPDLVTMDIHMPKMDGLEATAQIMAYTPTPILVVSTSVHGPGMGRAFDALASGALDVMKKVEAKDWEDLQTLGRDLIRRVKVLSRVKVITHIAGRKKPQRGSREALPSHGRSGAALVAIGSSTGGPSALMTVLGGLPKDLPVPVLITQHIADGFIPGLVEWLDGGCAIDVVEAADGIAPAPGKAYLAPTGSNLEFDGSAMRFSAPRRGQLYIPSADTLFSSVARSMRSRALGVILTGMGSDGASGLKEMRDAGATTIAQDEQTSTVFGMPKAAADMGAASEVLPIESIGPGIMSHLRS